jgi:signal transduction histidine kinase
MHLYQIFTNVLKNALEASIDNTPVNVELYKENETVFIIVKDNGNGIEPDDLTLVFEPYFTKKSKGTGLGLAIVKKLCDVNHCEIKIISEVGIGTEVKLVTI